MDFVIVCFVSVTVILPCTCPFPRGGLTDLYSVRSAEKSTLGVIAVLC